MVLVLVWLSDLAEWCNGSMKDFASLDVGSIPTSATNNLEGRLYATGF